MALKKDGSDRTTASSAKKKEEQSRRTKESPLTKIVIRRLPSSMTEEELLKQLAPIPDHTYMAFIPPDKSWGPNSFSRAYINFKDPQDLMIFHEKFDGYVFLDDQGHECPAVVEFAPYQKVPRKSRCKPDVKLNSIEKDVDYVKFLDTLGAEEQPSWTLEQTIQSLDGSHDNTPQETPLVAFLRQKREEKRKLLERQREDRRLKELDRKKQKEDERRRRIEQEQEAKARAAARANEKAAVRKKAADEERTGSSKSAKGYKQPATASHDYKHRSAPTSEKGGTHDKGETTSSSGQKGRPTKDSETGSGSGAPLKYTDSVVTRTNKKGAYPSPGQRPGSGYTRKVDSRKEESSAGDVLTGSSSKGKESRHGDRGYSAHRDKDADKDWAESKGSKGQRSDYDKGKEKYWDQERGYKGSRGNEKYKEKDRRYDHRDKGGEKDYYPAKDKKDPKEKGAGDGRKNNQSKEFGGKPKADQPIKTSSAASTASRGEDEKGSKPQTDARSKSHSDSKVDCKADSKAAKGEDSKVVRGEDAKGSARKGHQEAASQRETKKKDSDDKGGGKTTEKKVMSEGAEASKNNNNRSSASDRKERVRYKDRPERAIYNPGQRAAQRKMEKEHQ